MTWSTGSALRTTLFALASSYCALACAPSAKEPAREPAPAPADGRESTDCRRLYERVGLAYERLAVVQKEGTASSQFLAIADVMNRLDASLGELAYRRDDVRLVSDEYRAAGKSLASASSAGGKYLGQLHAENAKAARAPDAFTQTMSRVIAHCKTTKDADCRRVATILQSLAGATSPARIAAARAELGAVNSSDPILQGSIESLRENLGELAAFAQSTSDTDAKRQAHTDDIGRATKAFSSLQPRAAALCDKELSGHGSFAALR